MRILIKNMVAQGTKKFVLNELKKLGLRLLSFESAELIFEKDLTADESAALENRLAKYGLELVYADTFAGQVEFAEMAEPIAAQ